MGMELNTILMEQSMLENGKKEKPMDKVTSNIRTEAAMLVKYRETNEMDMELLRTKVAQNSQEPGFSIFRWVKELKLDRMAANIQVIFITEWRTVLEDTNGPMEQFITESGDKIKLTVSEFIIGQMVANTKDLG